MQIKPPCRQCQRIYLGGREGLCDLCYRSSTLRRKRSHCLCGASAVAVEIATVINPEGEEKHVELPLCAACLELERQFEVEKMAPAPASTAPNPVTIIVTPSLPRAESALRGRKLV